MEYSRRDLIQIHIATERLDEGVPEERATFGLLRILANGRLLTEGYDRFIDDRRDGPLVSGYYFAEWLAANWWRLRHEPKPSGAPSCSWQMSHCTAEIGEGYCWPNITIVSDGYRAIFQAFASEDSSASFLYQGCPNPVIVPWAEFEYAIDAFIERILALMRKREIPETNLNRLWKDLVAERSDPSLTRFRRFEALMGCDPDEVGEEKLRALLADESRLGEDGLDELAAVGGGPDAIPSADSIFASAQASGAPARLGKAPVAASVPIWGSVEPWRVAVAAARELREVAGLGTKPLTDTDLADFVETQHTLLTGDPADFSFVLCAQQSEDRVVLRSRHPIARRFDLARLIGDHAMRPNGPFHPATRGRSYRQQAQRAFAAEFLAPIEAVVEKADGDFSEERQIELASDFRVSELTINSLLKNNHFIERDEGDLGYAI